VKITVINWKRHSRY